MTNRQPRPACDDTGRSVVLDKASPLVGVALSLVCTCGATHYARAIDGASSIERAQTAPQLARVLRAWEVTLTGPWTAQLRTDHGFRRTAYTAPVGPRTK